MFDPRSLVATSPICKMEQLSFLDCIYADIVDGLVDGSGKIQKCAGWFLMGFNYSKVP